MGLNNQEPNNQGTKNHELSVRDGGSGDNHAHQAAHPRQKLIQENRENHNECGTKKAAHDGAHAANDHHEQQLE
jgi:hypothetical protein